MKFVKWMAVRRLNYFDVLIVSVAGEALKDGAWIVALALVVAGGFASVAIERKAGQA